MPKVILFREGTTKGSMRLVGDIKLPYRTMRASWARVTVRIDGGASYHLKNSKRTCIELTPGKHEMQCTGKGFSPGASVIGLQERQDAIIAITPAWEVGVTAATPLGSLQPRLVAGPQELQPYVFYRSLPYSVGHKSVGLSVVISLLISLAFAVVGFGVIAFAVWGYVAGGIGTALFLTACTLLLAPFCIPAGVGGVLTAVRFLQLPAEWRSPERLPVAG